MWRDIPLLLLLYTSIVSADATNDTTKFFVYNNNVPTVHVNQTTLNDANNVPIKLVLINNSTLNKIVNNLTNTPDNNSSQSNFITKNSLSFSDTENNNKTTELQNVKTLLRNNTRINDNPVDNLKLSNLIADTTGIANDSSTTNKSNTLNLAQNNYGNSSNSLATATNNQMEMRGESNDLKTTEFNTESIKFDKSNDWNASGSSDDSNTAEIMYDSNSSGSGESTNTTEIFNDLNASGDSDTKTTDSSNDTSIKESDDYTDNTKDKKISINVTNKNADVQSVVPISFSKNTNVHFYKSNENSDRAMYQVMLDTSSGSNKRQPSLKQRSKHSSISTVNFTGISKDRYSKYSSISTVNKTETQKQIHTKYSISRQNMTIFPQHVFKEQTYSKKDDSQHILSTKSSNNTNKLKHVRYNVTALDRTISDLANKVANMALQTAANLKLKTRHHQKANQRRKRKHKIVQNKLLQGNLNEIAQISYPQRYAAKLVNDVNLASSFKYNPHSNIQQGFTSNHNHHITHRNLHRKTLQANRNDQEDAMKRNKVYPNRIYSVEDQPANAEKEKKKALIQQAANELKSVLNKKNISPVAKSSLLSQIFDDKGDNAKANVATEIFREALEPSIPTNGAVGDLGAEMIKVSLVARKKSLTPHHRRNIFVHRKPSMFPERLTGQASFHKKLDLSENLPELEENVTGERKSKLKINASNFEWDSPKPDKKTIAKVEKKEKKQSSLLKLTSHLKKHIHSKPKNMSSLYRLLKNRGNKINMKGRSAKLLQVKELTNLTLYKANSSDVRQTRKDLVIELDDDYNEQNRNEPNREIQNYDPIMNLIRSFARNNNNDDIAIIDERDGNMNDDVRASNALDDGFISPNRRRIGENLFLESFAQNEQNNEQNDELNNEANNEELPEETGIQRSYLPTEESFIDDNYESRLETSFMPIGELESTDYDSPSMFDQVQDEPGMLNSQGYSPDNADQNTILMEVDKKRRHAIPVT